MKIRRTVPPAAAPIPADCLFDGFLGLFRASRRIEERQRELKRHFAVRHVFLFSSGKAALTVILRALKSLNPNRDEVLIPAYTCFSVPSAIAAAGLKVSLCDINPATLDFDYRLLEQTVGDSTLCVVPDHLFGIPADMDKIAALSRTKGFFVVEDAAQAMGGSYCGKQLGTLGDVGVFSLGRGKNLTCGSGGVVITNSDPIAQEIAKEYLCLEAPSKMQSTIDLLKVVFLALFIRPSLYWFPAGLSFLRLGETSFFRDFPIKKLSGMQAGLLKNWQSRLRESNGARKKSAQWFINALRLVDRSDDIPYLRLPIMAPSYESREKLLALSSRDGLGISAMYPMPINEISQLRDQFGGARFPASIEVSRRMLTIPTHQLLLLSDKEKIVALDLLARGLDICGSHNPALSAVQAARR